MMVARRFELPGIQNLSKDQEDALMLDKEGQHLVIGGPGTGKSVVALLRARRHHRDGDNYVFLVYNHLLNQASRQLFGDSLRSATWIGWFKQVFHNLTGTPVPVADQPWKINWRQAQRIIDDLTVPEQRELPYLIIDEGQDMPPAFYHALVGLGFENFYVVADQNQQISPERHSSRLDIEDALAIDGDAVIELRTNHRNSHPIARLARAFYTGDPASPPPELPARKAHEVARPELRCYACEDFTDIARRIFKLHGNEPHKLIGIIVANNETREKYRLALEDLLPMPQAFPFDDDPVPYTVQTYASGHDPTLLRFDQGGFMVINAQSCKGLEFDTVILADVEQHYFNPSNPDQTRKLFYVMTARARERLIMLRRASEARPVLELLPRDPQVLVRQEELLAHS